MTNATAKQRDDEQGETAGEQADTTAAGDRLSSGRAPVVQNDVVVPHHVRYRVVEAQRPLLTVFTLDSTMPLAPSIGGFGPGLPGDAWETLRDVPPSVDRNPIYDPAVANLLAQASTWAYSEPPEFAFMMDQCGLRSPANARCDNEQPHYLAMRISNPPSFVVATAYLIQSPDCSVAILCFRGTEPDNVLNWLTDLTISPEPFLGGHVHGGIFRNLQAVWPLVNKGLELVYEGAQATHENMLESNFSGMDLRELKALYFCGHSLGGAMAALAAANVWMSARYAKPWQQGELSLRDHFRGVYTFGAPMVADPTLAQSLDESLGHLVYRHVYKKDIVPRLPPLTTGRFAHFGIEYRSDGPRENWTRSRKAVSQSTSVASLAISGLAYVAEQFPIARALVQLPYSADHHSPRYYLSASEASLSSRL